MPTPVAERTTTMSIDPRTLQLHADFLRRVALGLLGDVTLAEDAVQRTWITTLGRRPEHPSKIRSWLASVTRNEARQIARAESRRRSREERTSRREAVPSASEIAERERIRREVVDAVMQLPEASRDVILLRYYEDMPPREIARRLELPVETVRTRLKRAIERMRSSLDRKHESREAWRSALMPFVVGPGGVIAGAATGSVGASGGAAGGAGGGVASGGAGAAGVPIVPATAIVASGVLATFLIVLAMAWRTGFGPFEDPAPVRSSTVSAVDEASSGTDGLDPGDPDASALSATAPAFAAAIPARAEAPMEQAGAGIRGRIVDAGGTPCRGLEIVVMGRRGESLYEVGGLFSTEAGPVDPDAIVRRVVRTDANGRYEVGQLPSGAYLTIAPAENGSPVRFFGMAFVGMRDPVPDALRAMLDGAFSTLGLPTPHLVEVAIGEVGEIDLERARGRSVNGRVVDRSGLPVVGAQVLSCPAMFLNSIDALHQPVRPPFSETTTDEDGRYRIEGALGSTGIAVTAPGYMPRVDVVEIPEPDAESSDHGVEDRVLEDAATWRVAGQVFDAHGPIVDAIVSLVPARRIVLPDAPGQPVTPTTRTGEHGEFTITFDTALGAPAVLRFEADGYGSIDARLSDSASPECEDLRIVLERSALVRVHVTGKGEVPAAGARVYAWDHEEYGIREVAETDDEGIAELRMLDEGLFRLSVSGVDGYKTLDRDVDFTEGFPSDTIEMRLEPVDRSLSIRVVDSDGAPVPKSLEFPGVERDFAYYSIHRLEEDPTDLVERGWLHELFEDRQYGYHTGGIRAGDSGNEAVVEFDDRWMSRSGWIVLRAAGHPPVVRPYGPDTESIELALDLGLVRSNVAVLLARPKTSWWQFVRELVAVVDTEDGRRVEGVVSDTRGATVLLEEAGRHQVRLVTNQGVGVAEVDVELGRVETIDVRIRSGGSISGSIVRMAEETVEIETPRPDLEIHRAEPNIIIRDGSEIRVRVFDREGRLLESEMTTDGNFSIRGIPAGDCVVRAYIPGFGYAQERVTLSEGEEIEDLRIGVSKTPFVEIRLAEDSLGEDVIVVEGRWTLWAVGETTDSRERYVDSDHRIAVTPNPLYIGPLEAGEYRLELLGPAIGRREAVFEIDENTPLPFFVTPR